MICDPLGGDIRIRGIVATDTAPLHFVEFASGLYTGSIRMGVMDPLPIPRIDMLIGDDLANAKVSGDSVVAPLERSDENAKVGDALTRRAPPCAVQSLKVDDAFFRSSPSNDSFCELSGTFLNDLYGAAEAGLCSGVNMELNKESRNNNAGSVQFSTLTQPPTRLPADSGFAFFRLVCIHGECPTWRRNEGSQSMW